MVDRLLDVDLEKARAHAEHAVGRAGRVATVREARGLVAYREGDWRTALKEFRTAQRLSGTHHLLPYIVDAERAMGRREHALDLARSPQSLTLDTAGTIELDIVVAGIRRDMGDPEAALVQLRGPELDPAKRKPWSGRLFYAYADTLDSLGRQGEAREWFAAAVDADAQVGTDAAERLDELDGTVFLDMEDDTAEDVQEDRAGGTGEDAQEPVARARSGAPASDGAGQAVAAAPDPIASPVTEGSDRHHVAAEVEPGAASAREESDVEQPSIEVAAVEPSSGGGVQVDAGLIEVHPTPAEEPTEIDAAASGTEQAVSRHEPARQEPASTTPSQATFLAETPHDQPPPTNRNDGDERAFAHSMDQPFIVDPSALTSPSAVELAIAEGAVPERLARPSADPDTEEKPAESPSDDEHT